ncbi:MAG: type II secretion system F family protein [Coprobacillaceae bacterium]
MNNEWLLLETIAMLLNQGYTIQDVISICKYVSHDKLLYSIEKKLLQGETLRNSILQTKLSKNFKEFFYFFSMQKEISNAIIDSLNICKEQNQIFKKLTKQLTYPLFLLAFLFFFSIFVTTFLMPEVQTLFKEFSIEQSMFFSIVFFILKCLPILFILIFFIGIFCICISVYVVRKQRYEYLDFIVLKIPLLSKWIKKYYSLKFAIYYHELLQAGYDSTNIITILTEQMMDTDIKMIVYEMQQEILNGKELLHIVEEFEYFEDMLATYFLLLLENGKHKDALQEYIDMNLRVLKLTIQKVIKILVPSIYGFVILFVLLVYLCIILPMMDIVNLM